MSSRLLNMSFTSCHLSRMLLLLSQNQVSCHLMSLHQCHAVATLSTWVACLYVDIVCLVRSIKIAHQRPGLFFSLPQSLPLCFFVHHSSHALTSVPTEMREDAKRTCAHNSTRQKNFTVKRTEPSRNIYFTLNNELPPSILREAPNTMVQLLRFSVFRKAFIANIIIYGISLLRT